MGLLHAITDAVDGCDWINVTHERIGMGRSGAGLRGNAGAVLFDCVHSLEYLAGAEDDVNQLQIIRAWYIVVLPPNP